MNKSVKPELEKLAARVEALEASVGSMQTEKRRSGITSALAQAAEQSTAAVSRARPRYRAVDKKGRVFLDEAAIGCDFRLFDLPDGAYLLEPTDEVLDHQRWTTLPRAAREIEEAMRERNSIHANGPTEPGVPTSEANDGPLTERLPRHSKRSGMKRPGPR